MISFVILSPQTMGQTAGGQAIFQSAKILFSHFSIGKISQEEKATSFIFARV